MITTATVTEGDDLDDIWYDTDTLFYIVVVMITFTSIVGTFLFYRDRLIRASSSSSCEDEEEEEDSTAPVNIVPRIEEPFQVSCGEEDDEASSSSSNDDEEETGKDTTSSTNEKITTGNATLSTIEKINAIPTRNERALSHQQQRKEQEDDYTLQGRDSPSGSFIGDADIGEGERHSPPPKAKYEATDSSLERYEMLGATQEDIEAKGRNTVEENVQDFLPENMNMEIASICSLTPNTVRRRNLEIVFETEESEIDDEPFFIKTKTAKEANNKEEKKRSIINNQGNDCDKSNSQIQKELQLLSSCKDEELEETNFDSKNTTTTKKETKGDYVAADDIDVERELMDEKQFDSSSPSYEQQNNGSVNEICLESESLSVKDQPSCSISNILDHDDDGTVVNGEQTRNQNTVEKENSKKNETGFPAPTIIAEQETNKNQGFVDSKEKPISCDNSILKHGQDNSSKKEEIQSQSIHDNDDISSGRSIDQNGAISIEANFNGINNTALSSLSDSIIDIGVHFSQPPDGVDIINPITSDAVDQQQQSIKTQNPLVDASNHPIVVEGREEDLALSLIHYGELTQTTQQKDKVSPLKVVPLQTEQPKEEVLEVTEASIQLCELPQIEQLKEEVLEVTEASIQHCEPPQIEQLKEEVLEVTEASIQHCEPPQTEQLKEEVLEVTEASIQLCEPPQIEQLKEEVLEVTEASLQHCEPPQIEQLNEEVLEVPEASIQHCEFPQIEQLNEEVLEVTEASIQHCELPQIEQLKEEVLEVNEAAIQHCEPPQTEQLKEEVLKFTEASIQHCELPQIEQLKEEVLEVNEAAIQLCELPQIEQLKEEVLEVPEAAIQLCKLPHTEQLKEEVLEVPEVAIQHCEPEFIKVVVPDLQCEPHPSTTTAQSEEEKEEEDDTHSATTTMGKILSKIFESDKLEDVPLAQVEKLGGKIIISEDGEYAIIDFEGKRKEYKIDKVKLRKQNSDVLNKKLRDSKDLSQLFEKLESLDCVGENKEPYSFLQRLADGGENGRVNVFEFDNTVSKKDHNVSEDTQIDSEADLSQHLNTEPKIKPPLLSSTNVNSERDVLKENSKVTVIGVGGDRLTTELSNSHDPTPITRPDDDSLLLHEQKYSTNSYKAVNDYNDGDTSTRSCVDVEGENQEQNTRLNAYQTEQTKHLKESLNATATNEDKPQSKAKKEITTDVKKSESSTTGDSETLKPSSIPQEGERREREADSNNTLREAPRDTLFVTERSPGVSANGRPDNNNYASSLKNASNVFALSLNGSDDINELNAGLTETTDVTIKIQQQQKHQKEGENQHKIRITKDEQSFDSKTSKDRQINNNHHHVDVEKSINTTNDNLSSCSRLLSLTDSRTLPEKHKLRFRSKSLSDLNKDQLPTINRDFDEQNVKSLLTRTQSMDFIRRRNNSLMRITSPRIKETNLDELMRALQLQPLESSSINNDNISLDYLLQFNDENNNINKSLVDESVSAEEHPPCCSTTVKNDQNEDAHQLESSYSETEIDPESEEDDDEKDIERLDTLCQNTKEYGSNINLYNGETEPTKRNVRTHCQEDLKRIDLPTCQCSSPSIDEYLLFVKDYVESIISISVTLYKQELTTTVEKPSIDQPNDSESCVKEKEPRLLNGEKLQPFSFEQQNESGTLVKEDEVQPLIKHQNERELKLFVNEYVQSILAESVNLYNAELLKETLQPLVEQPKESEYSLDKNLQLSTEQSSESDLVAKDNEIKLLADEPSESEPVVNVVNLSSIEQPSYENSLLANDKESQHLADELNESDLFKNEENLLLSSDEQLTENREYFEEEENRLPVIAKNFVNTIISKAKEILRIENNRIGGSIHRSKNEKDEAIEINDEPKLIMIDEDFLLPKTSEELETVPCGDSQLGLNNAPQHLQALVPEGARVTEDVEEDDAKAIISTEENGSADGEVAKGTTRQDEELLGGLSRDLSQNCVNSLEDSNEITEKDTTPTTDCTCQGESVDLLFVQRYVEEIIRKAVLILAEEMPRKVALLHQQQQQPQLNTEPVRNVSFLLI